MHDKFIALVTVLINYLSFKSFYVFMPPLNPTNSITVSTVDGSPLSFLRPYYEKADCS